VQRCKEHFDLDYGIQYKLIKQFNAHLTISTYFEPLMIKFHPFSKVLYQKIIISNIYKDNPTK
jgi:hypothetical protein